MSGELAKKSKKRIVLCGTCPFCGEAVEMELSKQEIKDMYRGFKMGPATAQLLGEKKLMVKYEAEANDKKLRDALTSAEFTAEEQQSIDQALAILKEKIR